jgi:hypothetical protein
MEQQIFVVFCDKCNPNAYIPPPNTGQTERGDYPFACLSYLVSKGMMVGTIAQALKGEDLAGQKVMLPWEERDYGLICPACILDEQYLEEVTEDSGAIDGEHPIFELAAKVLKPETSVETTTGTFHDDGTFGTFEPRGDEANQRLIKEAQEQLNRRRERK